MRQRGGVRHYYIKAYNPHISMHVICIYISLWNVCLYISALLRYLRQRVQRSLLPATMRGTNTLQAKEEREVGIKVGERVGSE